MHCMTTPIIEVAKDGETAKGLWLMYGAETMKKEDGKVSAYWAAGQFAMDFIKEDGEWKILERLMVYRTRDGELSKLQPRIRNQEEAVKKEEASFENL